MITADNRSRLLYEISSSVEGKKQHPDSYFSPLVLSKISSNRYTFSWYILLYGWKILNMKILPLALNFSFTLIFNLSKLKNKSLCSCNIINNTVTHHMILCVTKGNIVLDLVGSGAVRITHHNLIWVTNKHWTANDNATSPQHLPIQ